MTLLARDRKVISRLDRKYVAETFVSQKKNFGGSRWVAASNRYAADPVAVLADEIDKNIGHQQIELAQYIAASPILHASDGWSYLGKSLLALLKGDPHRAIHLAYYAELRATIGLLATEGVGVFSTNHFAVTRKNITQKLSATSGTHRFAWECLDYWATLPKAAQLLVSMIRPYGILLEDWFSSAGGTIAFAPQARGWLQQWGVDLRAFSDDRDARNLSSYQPDGIPKLWEITCADALEFVRDLWSSLEPSSYSKFSMIDQSILRIGIESLFQSRTGVSAQNRPDKFRPFAESIIKTQNLPPQIETQLVRYVMRASLPHNPAIFDYSKISATDPILGVHAVISRATLLLRLASGASLMQLQSSALTANSVAFWSDPLGKARGLWETALGNPMDMWADVQDMINAVETFQQQHVQSDQTFYKIRSQLSEALVSLGSSERVAIWAMTP